MGKLLVGILWLVSAVLTLGYTWRSYTSTYSQFPDSSSGGGIGTAVALGGSARYLLEKKGKSPSDPGGTGPGESKGGKGTAGDGETPKGSGGGSLWDLAKRWLGLGGAKPSGGGVTPEPVAPDIPVVP